jgi:hypothetical protein
MPTAWFALAAAALAALAGCRREEVTHYRVPKRAPAVPAAAPAPAPPPPAVTLRWTLPRGWSEGDGAGGGVRFATLKPPVAGRVEVSVTVLPGAAGGELANVNRWRGQIGLPPVDERGLAAARKIIGTRAGPVAVYDFTSGGDAGGSRLVAGLAEAKDGSTWFVKMSGDAPAVGAARTDFIRLLESLRFEDSR